MDCRDFYSTRIWCIKISFLNFGQISFCLQKYNCDILTKPAQDFRWIAIVSTNVNMFGHSFELKFLEFWCACVCVDDTMIRYVPPATANFLFSSVQHLQQFIFYIFSLLSSVHTENAQYFTTRNKIINGGIHILCTCMYNIFFSLLWYSRSLYNFVHICWQNIHEASTSQAVSPNPISRHSFRSHCRSKQFYSSASPSSSFVCVILCRVRNGC